MKKTSLAYVGTASLLALLYVALARLGLGLHPVGHFATLVWPPSGISLAAVLLLGYRIWPGIAVGAVVVNVWTGAPLPVALGIGTGNTLEAVLGAYALQRIPGFSRSLDRVQDVIGLIVLAALLSSAVSATIGVLSLLAGGLITPARFAATWQAWWLGDAVGALIVAPLLLTWQPTRYAVVSRVRLAEAGLLGVLLAEFSFLIFETTTAHARAFMLSPLLIWVAVRFGQRGAARATFLVAVIAIWATVRGHGPFAQEPIVEGLITLQTFLAFSAVTFLTLGAATTARHRVEAALRESEARHAATVEAALDAIITMDHRGRITECNPAAARIFGLGREQALGRDMADAIIPERLRGAHRRGLAHYLATGEGPILGKRLELPGLRQDGSEFPAELTVARIRGPGPPTFTGFIRDITDRKAAEAERDRLIGELERAVRAREDFLAITAHELKTPLTPLRLHTEALVRAVGTHADPMPLAQLAPRLEMIVGTVHRLEQLIDRLLDVALIAAGRLSLQREEIDLADVVGELAERLAEPLRRAHCTLSLRADRPVLGRWDRVRIEQVVSNLLGNAMKYGAGKPIEVSIEGDEQWGRIAVRDHGIGMTPEQQSRLFERFERLEPLHHYGGFGVGLWIVRQIVDAHGGRIAVWSRLGEGARFTVELPREPAPT